MTKVKEDTPKRGTKSKIIQEATVPLRRSPRKAVLSAKKLRSDELSAVSKIVKQTPAKKTTPVKKTPRKNAKTTTESARKTAKSPSPAKSAPKNATKATRIGIKKAKSLSVTRNANASAANAKPPTSPRLRGRPKKDTGPTKSEIGAADRSNVSSRTRARTPDDVAEVPMPTEEHKWTDSPRKRSPSKGTPKKGALKANFEKDISITDFPVTAPGGIRESIECPSGETEGRSGKVRTTVSQSPSRARNKSPSKSPSRKQSATTASTAHPKSPVKSNSDRPSNPTVADEGLAAIFTKARSPIRARKSRSKSPNKPRTGRVGRVSPSSPTRSPELHSPRPRGRPKSSISEEQVSPLKIAKTRSSRSPTKRPAIESRRVRSVSPVKLSRDAVAARRSSDPTPSPGKSRPRSLGKSPKPHSQSARKPSNEAAFEKRFVHKDEYGKALRRVESNAYNDTKAGEDTMADRDPQVSREDENLAKERGIRRARLEDCLNIRGGVIPRQAKANRSRIPATSRELISDLGNELDDSAHMNSSSNRARTSSNPRTSPGKHADRLRSPESRSSKIAADEDAPLSKGQPSAEGRGAIHSVTNAEFIPDTNTRRKNPFFETMPAPEVWHRRMPSFLPFGETPFMERAMSRQITEDLARGTEQPAQSSWYSNWIPSLGKGKKPSTEQRPYTSPWVLSHVSEDEVDAAMEDLQGFIDSEPGMVGSKRKASSPLIRSPTKRAKRRSSGNDYMMSGALQ